MSKNAEYVAERLCYGEECYCDFDCGVKKNFTVRNLGTGQTCPIAKYGLPKTRYVNKDFKDALDNIVELNETYLVCAECEHAIVEGDYIRWPDDDYKNFCLDCPVHKAAEGMMENIAEAMMS